ncbi:MAG: MFS transporter [Actinoplanes sp.]
MALGGDFRRLWTAFTISEAGSAVSFGAIPLIAVLVLDVSEFQVSLLAALSGLAAAAVALPAGPWIEFRHKRPVMIGADLARFAALGSVPVAMAVDRLTYVQLCLVAMTQAVGVVVFASASGAHLKALVDPADRDIANGRFEATFWTVLSAGPPLGGALTSWLGVAWTVTADAVSFLLSAVGVRSLRSPEPDPPVRKPQHGRWTEIADGWRYILTHPGLRALFFNSLVFGAGVMAGSPLMAVLMLGELHFPAWQYGLAFGLPCVAGVLGAVAMRPLTGRFGGRRVLLASGVCRALTLTLLAAVPAGPPGLLLVIAVESLVIFGSGVFNPSFATYRMTETEDGYLSRVIACWSVASRTAQPIGILLGGALAAATSVRFALLIAGVVVLSSVVLLPWRAQWGPRRSRTLASSSS